MSEKRPRRPIERSRARLARRVASSVLVGGLLVTLVIVVADRRSGGHTSAATAPPTPAATSAPRAALQGVYDVTLTVGSVEYGATWPAANPRLTPGQTVTQRWSIECGSTACSISIITGHIAEDPDRSTVSTENGALFSVAGTQPASPDGPGVPTGCGLVNAIDLQQMALTTTSEGASFSGRYTVHHATVHVEGPVASGIGSCDSFNAVLDIAGTRR